VKAQRGFTLLEMLVAAAIGSILGALLVWLVHATAFSSAHLDARLAARSAVERLAERLRSDAASAWTVFVPAQDVFGANNADGHELDFASQDAARQTHWWAYAFNAAARQVTVYAYAPGGAPSAGDVYDGITGFTAQTHPISDVANPASTIYDPLFAGAAAAPIDVDFGWSALAVGGNHLVRADVSAAGIDRRVLLASGTAPTHFTIVVTYTPPPPTPTP
jgi:prepilin-type N-terminal cleavage/methylation domain-containing protein